MSAKKYKSGYDLQKEKITNLQEQLVQAESARNTYSARLDLANADIHNLEIERDEWKAKYKQKFGECIELQNNKVDSHDALMNVMRERDKWREECQKCIDREKRLKSRIAFILDHCPFWVRWIYRNKFEKGK